MLCTHCTPRTHANSLLAYEPPTPRTPCCTAPQALLTKDLVNASFRERCGPEWAPDLSLGDFVRSWSRSWGLSALCYCVRRAEPGFNRLPEDSRLTDQP